MRAWIQQYKLAFESDKVHLGIGKDPFANAEVGVEDAWLLEGMLLSSWLALAAGC
jgi:hypothetical protein